MLKLVALLGLVGFVFGFSLALPTKQDSCDITEQYYNGKCYNFQLQVIDYASSSAKCKSLNHKLVQILGQKDQNYINFNAMGATVWLGLRFDNGKWYWDDDGAITKPTFTNWENQVEPTDPTKACAVLDTSKNGVWTAVDCAEKYFFICQAAANPSRARH
ncbi:unnamed protein product, partial [Mesorhabditis belari]|uniref:C-type lectin domain-containing protein n=1 Tax=Mesorhabditis belari TaxID=2138241 RepID=A0AAF3FDK2_9BILA